MYRQNVIGPIEYKQINNNLAQSIGSGFEESLVDAENQSNGENMVIDESTGEENDENEEDELLRLINLTFNHIVQDGKEELVKLIDELKEILTSDTLLELEKAAGEFLIREKRDGKTILPIIYDLLRELENSSIPLSKQLRLKMLIDDIDQNRYRVKSVFKWLDDAEDNGQDILKRLFREELLSEEQFNHDESHYRWYTDLMHQTDALYQGFDRHTRYPRASRSKKWAKILRPIWNEIQLTDLTSVYDSSNNDEYYEPTSRKVEFEKTA